MAYLLPPTFKAFKSSQLLITRPCEQLAQRVEPFNSEAQSKAF